MPIEFESTRSRYIAWYGEEPTAASKIAEIELALGLTLPNSTREVASFYCGGLLGGVSHHSLDTCGPATNVTEETLRLRSVIDLPHRYVVLAEPPESLLVLDCDSGAVVWCSAEDAYRLGDVTTMLSPCDTWPDYLSFFAFLLNEEQAERDGE